LKRGKARQKDRAMTRRTFLKMRVLKTRSIQDHHFLVYIHDDEIFNKNEKDEW
jgi:hypothetical protein